MHIDATQMNTWHCFHCVVWLGIQLHLMFFWYQILFHCPIQLVPLLNTHCVLCVFPSPSSTSSHDETNLCTPYPAETW